MKNLIALVGTVIWVGACGSAGEPAVSDSTGASTTTSLENVTTAVTNVTTTMTEEETSLSTVPRSEDGLLALAKEARLDLAAELDVPEEQIAVTSATAVTWNDSSIGCPQPGMSYTQAQVEGARITLLHDGTTYTYHQSSGAGLFLCEMPADDTYAVSKRDSGDLELIPPPGYND